MYFSYASTICSSSQARAASTYRDVESDSFDRGESYSDLDGVHTLLEQDPEQAKVAIQTLQKMLSNISAHPDVSTYSRYLDLSNSSFCRKQSIEKFDKGIPPSARKLKPSKVVYVSWKTLGLSRTRSIGYSIPESRPLTLNYRKIHSNKLSINWKSR